eukprot:3489797-Amphidinium_carterae.1
MSLACYFSPLRYLARARVPWGCERTVLQSRLSFVCSGLVSVTRGSMSNGSDMESWQALELGGVCTPPREDTEHLV